MEGSLHLINGEEQLVVILQVVLKEVGIVQAELLEEIRLKIVSLLQIIWVVVTLKN